MGERGLNASLFFSILLLLSSYASLLGVVGSVSAPLTLGTLGAKYNFGFDALLGECRATIVETSPENYKNGVWWSYKQTGQTLLIPDTITTSNTPYTVATSPTLVFKSLEEFEQYQYYQHSTQIGGTFLLGFSETKSSAEVELLLQNSTNQLYMATREFSMFNIVSWPYTWENNSESRWESDTLNLPPHYNDSSRAAYSSYIDTYGTDYCFSVEYGAMITYVIATSVDFVQQYSESWTYEQAELVFGALDFEFDYSMSKSSDISDISEEFLSASTVRLVVVGGVPGEQSTSSSQPPLDFTYTSNITFSIPKWVDSAKLHPAILRSRLLKLWQMIPPYLPQRYGLAAATVSYMNQTSAQSSSTGSTCVSNDYPQAYEVHVDHVNGIRLANHHPLPVQLSGVLVDDAEDVDDLLGSASLPEQPVVPLVPGLEYLGGWDAATGLFKYIPILEIDYAENPSYCTTTSFCDGGCWENPFNASLQYLVPPNVCIENWPESYSLTYQHVVQSLEDVEGMYTTVTSSSSGGFFHSGSTSTTSSTFMARYYVQDMALCYTDFYEIYYKLSLQPSPLNQNIKYAISLLPKNYSSDNNTASYHAYHRFIEYYGTHYLLQVYMGGQSKGLTWFHKCFLETQDTHWVEQQSEDSYLGIVSSGTSSYYYSNQVNESFAEWSFTEVQYCGGDIFLPLNDTATWKQSVPSSPFPVTIKGDPIYLLMSYDPERQQSMKQAVDDHMSMNENVAQMRLKALQQWNFEVTPSWCSISS